MPFSSPRRSPRLFSPNYFRVIITGGDFQRQRGRFLGFCLAPNGTAHAVTTGHANVFLDSGVVVIVPTYFLCLLTPDAASPLLRLSSIGVAYLDEPPPGYALHASRNPNPSPSHVSGVVPSYPIQYTTSSNDGSAASPLLLKPLPELTVVSRLEEKLLVFRLQEGIVASSCLRPALRKPISLGTTENPV
jgi:hypothetical protein